MDHTIALIQRSHEGDEEAREQLVKENTGLVWCIVKRFYSSDVFPVTVKNVGIHNVVSDCIWNDFFSKIF